MDCIFCKIITKDLPARIVYEDDQAMAFLDINPINKGHLLVVPLKHAPDFTSTTPAELANLIQVVQKVARGMTKALGTDDYNIGLNNGQDAGQLIPHVHFHLIPRFPNDGLKHWPDKKYDSDQEMAEIAEKIRKEIK